MKTVCCHKVNWELRLTLLIVEKAIKEITRNILMIVKIVEFELKQESKLLKLCHVSQIRNSGFTTVPL